jgi:hypothetical protein
MMEAFRMSKLSAVLLPLLVAATTALFASDADRIHEEDDIRESVFSYQFEQRDICRYWKYREPAFDSDRKA